MTGSDCDGCCRPLVQTYEQAGYHYLEVCNVTANDSGMYVGTVQNSAGTDTASAELDVFGECMESLSLALTVSSLFNNVRSLTLCVCVLICAPHWRVDLMVIGSGGC